jgi:hypothetical protein
MDTTVRRASRLDNVGEIIWAIAMICLPITSFPLFTQFSGSLVAPFSILPFGILMILTSLPILLRKGSLPKESIPLMAFTLFVIISCAAAYFIYIPGFKGRTVTGQEIRALFTLAVGITFYLVTVTWIKTIGKLKTTWKYITIGGFISLAWAAIQAYFIFKHYNAYPSWVQAIQSLLAVRSPSFIPNTGRVSGMTYEASWFAHQMVIVYLPIWIAATYHKTSAFSFRLFRISVENILLVFGILAFFLSSPRIGLVSLFLMTAYLFIKINLVVHRRIVSYLSGTRKFTFTQPDGSPKLYVGALASFSMIAVYIVVLGGAILFSIQRDWRLATLVSDPPTPREIVGALMLDQPTLLELSHRFVFLERMVYWLNGWNTFNLHPWLGVGLGNAGFFFPEQAPALGWSSPEIRSVLYYWTQLPNVKSLWFRLLAETGLVGFSLFACWLFVLYQSSKFSQDHPNSTIKTFAFAGQLALLAFLGESLSIDSFALPYFWVVAGIVAGLAMLYRQETRKSGPTN